MLELSGNAGKKSQVAFIREHGLGILRTAADYRPPRAGIPWVLDNGAFSHYRQGTPFDGERFLRVLARVPRDQPPLFVVCPDVVAGGMDSLRFSQEWRDRLSPDYDWLPWYLAVQDGMPGHEVAAELRTGRWAGLFVGGTMPWKLATVPDWVRIGHKHGVQVHVGRIGQPDLLAWCRDVGVDSVDSTSWARNDTHHRVLAGRAGRSLVSWAAVDRYLESDGRAPDPARGNLEVAP